MENLLVILHLVLLLMFFFIPGARLGIGVAIIVMIMLNRHSLVNKVKELVK